MGMYKTKLENVEAIFSRSLNTESDNVVWDDRNRKTYDLIEKFKIGEYDEGYELIDYKRYEKEKSRK